MHAYSLADLVRAVDLFHCFSGPVIRTETPVVVPTVVDGPASPHPRTPRSPTTTHGSSPAPIDRGALRACYGYVIAS